VPRGTGSYLKQVQLPTQEMVSLLRNSIALVLMVDWCGYDFDAD
jgi:hypothetical protein